MLLLSGRSHAVTRAARVEWQLVCHERVHIERQVPQIDGCIACQLARFLACILNIGECRPLVRLRVGVLLDPQIVTCTHAFERLLEVETFDDHRANLARVVVQLKYGCDSASSLQRIVRTPVHFVLILDRGAKLRADVDEYVIAAPVAVTLNQESRLINAIDDAIRRYAI